MNDETKKSFYISVPSLRPPRLCANLVFSAEMRNESRRDAEKSESDWIGVLKINVTANRIFERRATTDLDGQHGKSRQIVLMNIVFENKLAGRPCRGASRVAQTARSGPIANA
jgi:hypothetical protein